MQAHPSSQIPSQDVIHVAGTFDGSAALALRERLRLHGVARAVVIDFSGVREFYDLSVAVLASEINRRHVTIRGITAHHSRLFRYFGVGV